MITPASFPIISYFFPFLFSFESKRSGSNFRGDLDKSKVFQAYLDLYVYPIMMPHYGWTYERVVDKDRQSSGIDIIVSHGDRIVNVDEKAQIEYLDNNIPTMAFEISYNKDGEQRVGWLFDRQKRTEFIFYVTHIKTKSGKGFLYRPEDILSCRIYCVNLSQLVEKLDSVGLNYISCVNLFRAENKAGEVILRDLRRSKLKRSTQKAESPINLIINQAQLEKDLEKGCLQIWN